MRLWLSLCPARFFLGGTGLLHPGPRLPCFWTRCGDLSFLGPALAHLLFSLPHLEPGGMATLRQPSHYWLLQRGHVEKRAVAWGGCPGPAGPKDCGQLWV